MLRFIEQKMLAAIVSLRRSPGYSLHPSTPIARISTSPLRPNGGEIDRDHYSILIAPSGPILSKLSQRYLLHDGVVSLAVELETGDCVEAAMVGRDIVLGALSALGEPNAVTSAVVLLPGADDRSQAPVSRHLQPPAGILPLSPLNQAPAGAGRALRQSRFKVPSPTNRRSILLIRPERRISAALIAAIVSRNVLTFDPSDTIPPITTAIDPKAVA